MWTIAADISEQLLNTFCLGIAAIDFTYSSWLMAILQRHVAAWRDWYRSNCDVRLILPKKKRIHYKKKYKPSEIEIIDVD